MITPKWCILGKLFWTTQVVIQPQCRKSPQLWNPLPSDPLKPRLKGFLLVAATFTQKAMRCA